jgi:hypothetical protein
MDTHVEEIKRRGFLGADLTNEDWKILLSDAEEVGSLQGVLIALTKLQTHPVTTALESLLCTAICVGDAETAIDTCRHIGRDLLPSEKSLLVESVVLSGNVGGFIKHVDDSGDRMKLLLHTAIVIGVCRFLYKKSTGIVPKLTLATWLRTYHREFGYFSPSYSIIKSEYYPEAILLRLKRTSLAHFAGALLVEGLISREDFRFIIKTV